MKLLLSVAFDKDASFMQLCGFEVRLNLWEHACDGAFASSAPGPSMWGRPDHGVVEERDVWRHRCSSDMGRRGEGADASERWAYIVCPMVFCLSHCVLAHADDVLCIGSSEEL